MGRADGGDHRRAALCMRRRNDSAFAAMAVGRYEHGQRGCVYDHRSGYKNYEFRRAQNRVGDEMVCAVYCICDTVLTGNGVCCELRNVKEG